MVAIVPESLVLAAESLDGDSSANTTSTARHLDVAVYLDHQIFWKTSSLMQTIHVPHRLGLMGGQQLSHSAASLRNLSNGSCPNGSTVVTAAKLLGHQQQQLPTLLTSTRTFHGQWEMHASVIVSVEPPAEAAHDVPCWVSSWPRASSASCPKTSRFFGADHATKTCGTPRPGTSQDAAQTQKPCNAECLV